MREVANFETRELMDAIDAHFPQAPEGFYKALEAEILRQKGETIHRHNTYDFIARTLSDNLDWCLAHPDHPTVKPTPEQAALLPLYIDYTRQAAGAVSESRATRWSAALARQADSWLGR